MSAVVATTPSSRLRKAPALLAGLLGVALSLALFRGLRHREQQAREDGLRQAAQERAEVLHTRVLRSLEVLHGIAALFTVREEVSRREFQAYVSGALARQAGLQALAWDARVPAAEREEREAQARAEGFAHFQFREETPSGELFPAGRRAEYFPVLYLEPVRGNEDAFGFDVGSEPRRRQALEQARDTGAAAATAPIHLAQEKGTGLGFLVFEPIFEGRPVTVPEKQAALRGYAVAVFRFGDLITSSLQAARLGEASLSVADVPSGVTIYGHPGAPARPGALAATKLLEIAGRSWRLQLEQEPLSSGSPGPWAACGAGLLCTSLLTAYLWKSQQSATALAASNTALLEEVTVRKAAEATAESANRAKSIFLANMSHEIRTPMNAILGYAQILERNAGLHPFQRDAIGTISTSCDHLLQLVNNILDLSKIDAGHMEVTTAPFDLAALLQGLVDLFHQPCEEKLLGLRYEGPAGEPLAVRGDEGKLRQVLINLLGNAVKFTARGRVILRAAALAEEWWRFAVEDTGPGITASEREIIFMPFRQGSETRGAGGTGLGLTIARRQVELMGGQLELISPLSAAGSIFSFAVRLPAVPAHPAAAPPRLGSRRFERLAEGCKVRALVVDDIPENREVLALLLGAVGCEVSLAETGRQALEAVRLAPPDVVFLDMRLPDGDGVEVIRQLVHDYRASGLKLVATSASALTHERERFLEAGADDFVAKPFRAERLYSLLEQLLRVTFVGPAAPAETSVEPSEVVNLSTVELPEELATRLVMAAELHSATVLKSCLGEMERLGPAAARLAEHLRVFLASYDMASIQRLVAQVPVRAGQLEEAGQPVA